MVLKTVIFLTLIIGFARGDLVNTMECDGGTAEFLQFTRDVVNGTNGSITEFTTTFVPSAQIFGGLTRLYNINSQTGELTPLFTGFTCDLTSCPIEAGNPFTYRFKVEGTLSGYLLFRLASADGVRQLCRTFY